MITPDVFKEHIGKLKDNEEINEAQQRAYSWINNYGVKNRIETFARNLDVTRPRKRLNFEVVAGSGSWTDNETVRLGLSEDWFQRSMQEYVILMKFLAAHEMGHINWSDFVAFKNFQRKAESYFNKKYGIDGAGKFAGEMLNITEDGRIERAQANVYRGMLKYFRYVNGVNYLNFTGEQLGIVALTDFRNTILTLAKTGLLPLGYEERLKGSEVDEAIQKSRPYITKAVQAETTRICADATWEILMLNEEFIAEAMKPQEIDKDDLEKKLKGDDLRDEQSSEGDSGDSSQENPSQDSDDNSSSGTGETFIYDPLADMDGEPNFEGQPSRQLAPQGDVTPNFSDDSNDAEAVMKTDDEADADKSVNSKDELVKALDELITDTKEESADFIDKAKEVAKREDERVARETAHRESSQASNERIDTILSEHRSGLDFRYAVEDIIDNGPVPNHVEQRGRRLRRDLEEIFLDKRGWSVPNQRSGQLDPRQLYRAGAGLNQRDVFIRQHQPEDTNWVVSVLVDNSGSMNGSVSDSRNMLSGTKSDMAREATTMLEMALNDIVPFKISRFDVSSRHGLYAIQHAQVRGWEQKTKDIISWNATPRTGGGNADAISISVSTEELINRPETKKLLIVLSDGLPSQNTTEQVEDAVNYAREEGVHVVGIGFGDSYELLHNGPSYRQMYGEDVILTEPSELSLELVKVLERTISLY